jgi:biotin carboxylase
MNLEFQRVAIVNRGEAAMRFIHAAREFNQEQGTPLCAQSRSSPNRTAMPCSSAKRTKRCVSAPLRSSIKTLNKLKSSYVDYGRLDTPLTSARADAVWVGWGFVAEHAAFADLCRELGIVFIGPDGDAMRRVGDKIASKRLAEQAHIPVAPWSDGPVETLADAESPC